MTRTTLAAFAALVLLTLPAAADESEYLGRFAGSFSGSGSVRQSADGSAYDANCDMTGTVSGARLTLSGSCRAMLLFSRDVGADIVADEGGGYAGTYTGSRIGPAAVSGRRDGDRVTLDITWPAPVNGDTHAVMTITNAGAGSFSIQVVDRDGADGPEVVVSDITVTRE